MNIRYLFLILLPVLMWGCKDENDNPDNGNEMIADDFIIVPENPTIKDEIMLVFHGCNFFHTTTVQETDNTIHIKKHFNSQLKWPCIAENDTIEIGKLRKGDYQVKLEIIDLNPSVTDTVYYSMSRNVVVTNK